MNEHFFSVSGNLVDIFNNTIYPAVINISGEKIQSIQKLKKNEIPNNVYIMPGFVDSHVHIESSMLVPSEFARLAVVHGTVATVSDPHEIANVCGKEGVHFMIENGKNVPFKFFFGAPSCVPATGFETAGAQISAEEIKKLLELDDIKYLSEMMNFPGVLNEDKEVMEKIAAAFASNKPVDGHAPGLRGADAIKYISAGISTDHECFTREEALEKLQYGMKIIIREGSAAKNFDALHSLLQDHADMMMFCSDDKHPDSLVEGHINMLCKRAQENGIDLYKTLKAACINPVLHYKLNVGLLREDDPADFVVVNNLSEFKVLQTYINGKLVAENGQSLIQSVAINSINNFNCKKIKTEAIKIDFSNQKKLLGIEALDGQLITNKFYFKPKVSSGKIVSDTENDILKLVIVNRYTHEKPAMAFVKNFGLKQGAIASSVAHDSHNIIAVGIDDESITKAINMIIEEKGGVSCVTEEKSAILPLPVAGLMSALDGYKVAVIYTEIDQLAKSAGSTLSAPFMTLSFMALLVIPHIKLSDKGLFDVDAFNFIDQYL